MSERLLARLEAELAGNGPPEPPWARYPWIEQGSIGWRMGIGESWSMLWGAYVRTRLTDLPSTLAYFRAHPQAPRSWTDSLTRLVASVDATIDPHAFVLAERWVGDDVAYPVWVRNEFRHGGMTAPWTWRGSSDPKTAWRYDARRLGWWARWIAHDCPDRLGWYASAQVAPAAWGQVAAALVSGVVEDPWTTLNGGAERFLPVMMRDGTLPPPWVGGHPPMTHNEWQDDRADDRHRWAWWVLGTFEDAATWRAYLASTPPPPAWRQVLDQHLFEHLVQDP